MYFVCWQSLFTDASGIIGPIRDKRLAETVALNGNAAFGDIVHWAEEREQALEAAAVR